MCDLACRGSDVIVHLAANTGVGPSVENPRFDMEANVMGTFNMLEAAHRSGASRFVFASSGAPIGEAEPPIHEELPAHPVSPYGASKLAGEGYCSVFYRTFGLKTIALRFGNVYGPGSARKSSIIAKFIKQALTDETCEVYGDGTQTRDFIFIDDLTEAVLKAADFSEVVDVSNAGSSSTLSSGSPWGEVFQIATSREHTVNEVAEMLRSVLREYGIGMKIAHGDRRLGDVLRNYSDTTKAREVLGWESATELLVGIRKTVDFFLNKGEA